MRGICEHPERKRHIRKNEEISEIAYDTSGFISMKLCIFLQMHHVGTELIFQLLLFARY